LLACPLATRASAGSSPPSREVDRLNVVGGRHSRPIG
jgi:hypothetical protein